MRHPGRNAYHGVGHQDTVDVDIYEALRPGDILVCAQMVLPALCLPTDFRALVTHGRDRVAGELVDLATNGAAMTT